MTNGEKIKEIFPNAEIDKGKDGNDIIWIAIDCWTTFTKDWWNAEYKEPTTKNDLGVDCISRQDVLTEIIRFSTEEGASVECQQLYCDVNNMPSVTPQEPRWIPVSEKLPNDRDWYLGIFKEPDTGWINPLPFICDYVGRETKATTKEYWILHGFTDRDYKECDYYYNLECVAWMPLPKAYREVEV